MRLATLETAVVDWLMRVVIPTLPAFVQLGAGFVIPGALQKIEKMLNENSAFLRESGTLQEDGSINSGKLREAMFFPFQYREKIEIEMPGVKFYITRQNIEEIISTAERLEQSQ